jgi:hypothetical protein
MNMRRGREAIGAIAACLLLTIGGCGGGDGLPREPIAGRVTLDGEPLDLGNIQFMAADPAAGPITGGGATITGGRYEIGREKGLIPGSYRVMIFASDAPGAAAGPGGTPAVQTDGLAKARVHERYNTKSDLKVEVIKGGENAFNFDMKSR